MQGLDKMYKSILDPFLDLPKFASSDALFGRFCLLTKKNYFHNMYTRILGTRVFIIQILTKKGDLKKLSLRLTVLT